MEQKVFQASLMFFIPIQKMKKEYQVLDMSDINPCRYFLYSVVNQCRICDLSKNSNESIYFNTRNFYYKSFHNGIKEVWRKISISPYLIVFDPSQGLPVSILSFYISIDKTFGVSDSYKNLDFCTEFDLVHLKKAFFEKGENGLHCEADINSEDHYTWLLNTLNELDTIEHEDISIPYSISDIKVQSLTMPKGIIEHDDLIMRYNTAYYDANSNNSIDDFLSCTIDNQSLTEGINKIKVDERYFIYGLLYANDNFMMLHKDSMNAILNNYYTNNMVEKFWADDGNLVHVTTHCPFIYPAQEQPQDLKKNPTDDIDTLYDMCFLINIKFRLCRISSNNSLWTRYHMEKEIKIIKETIDQRQYNFSDFDKRIYYLQKMFGIKDIFDSIMNITLSQKRLRDLIFQLTFDALAICISIISLVVSICKH